MKMGVDDEREVERYRVEDPVAFLHSDELTRKWERWGAIWAARKYSSQRGRVSIEDIEQAGRLGVFYASREYDESKGKFPAWAKYYIMSECTKLLARGARVVSMPRDWKETVKPVVSVMSHMANNGDTPDLNKALNVLDLGETKREYTKDVYEAAGKEGNMFNPYKHDGVWIEDLSDEIDKRDRIEKIKRAADKLPHLHKEVVMDQIEGVPTTHTSKRLGITLQTLHTYRKTSIEWLKYDLGVGPRPREKQPSGNTKERIDYAKFA